MKIRKFKKTYEGTELSMYASFGDVVEDINGNIYILTERYSLVSLENGSVISNGNYDQKVFIHNERDEYKLVQEKREDKEW